MGAAHLSQGASGATHRLETTEALNLLPATTLPCILGWDGNAELTWAADVVQGVAAVGGNLKAESMVGQLQEKGFSIVSPVEGMFHTPTSRPRKPGAVGHQIDFLAVKHAAADRAVIRVDSYVSIDGDHDIVECKLDVQKQRGGCKKKTDTRPRVVVGEIPPQEMMSQERIKHLAQTHTKPRAGTAYRDPSHVVDLFRAAKHSHSKEDWKRAHKARREARSKWEAARLERALQGDWREVGYLRTRERRGWEAEFACAMAAKDVDPHEAVHEHLSGIFAKGEPVDNLMPQIVAPSPEITIDELRRACGKSKKGKAVGHDKTSAELLHHLMRDEVSAESLRAWFADILRSGELPDDWDRAVMVVKQAKDLRPIAMGSSVGKVFSRILLNRVACIMGHETPIQCAGANRQTADYLYSVAKSFDLEREWRCGTVWARLDISIQGLRHPMSSEISGAPAY